MARAEPIVFRVDTKDLEDFLSRKDKQCGWIIEGIESMLANILAGESDNMSEGLRKSLFGLAHRLRVMADCLHGFDGVATSKDIRHIQEIVDSIPRQSEQKEFERK